MTNKKIFIVLGGVVVALILIGGAFVLLTLKPRPTLTEDKIDTANWQTYRNEEYGFEIKYPANKFVIESIDPNTISILKEGTTGVGNIIYSDKQPSYFSYKGKVYGCGIKYVLRSLNIEGILVKLPKGVGFEDADPRDIEYIPYTELPICEEKLIDPFNLSRKRTELLDSFPNGLSFIFPYKKGYLKLIYDPFFDDDLIGYKTLSTFKFVR